jgi:hypothetical protein
MDHFFLVCSHIRLVEAQELAYAEEAASLARYVEAFGIY